ncbi:MAG: hypothetical protein M0036_23250 [Desulfobacteraceae bacterium]|nr:hypothetical protein [Desulfobacteraceae bacterium]
MYRRIFNANMLGLTSFIVVAARDAGDSAGGNCEKLESAKDTIVFRLPAATKEVVAKYVVELINPISKKSLGLGEGKCGQTLVFALEQNQVRVSAIMISFGSNGAVLNTTEIIVLDLDYRSLDHMTFTKSGSMQADEGSNISINADRKGADLEFAYLG